MSARSPGPKGMSASSKVPPSPRDPIVLSPVLHGFPGLMLSFLPLRENPLAEILRSQAVVARAFNPSTWEAEAGRFLNSTSAWSTE